MSEPYAFLEQNKRLWALHRGRPLGAINKNQVRTYTYPVYTPAGINLLQEAPPDHLHHQGIMVGQDHLNGHNFWAMLHAGHPMNQQLPKAEERFADETGAELVQDIIWITVHGQSVMRETRRTRFEAWEEGTWVEVRSLWQATFGDLYIAATKEGGLGMRLNPALETAWGGVIRSSTGKIGGAEVFDSEADWVEISGHIGGTAAGMAMMPHPTQEKLPWFSRDYGIHLYSAFRNRDLRLSAGETYSMRIGFLAYDGEADEGRAAAAWDRYRRMD